MAKYMGLNDAGELTFADNPEDLARPLYRTTDGVTGIGHDVTRRDTWQAINDQGTREFIPPDIREEVVQIAGGYGYSIALLKDGSVWSWGYSTNGNLGREIVTGSATVVNVGPILGIPLIIKIACGGRHVLLLDVNGKVWSFGYNASGELGRAVASGTASVVNVGMIESLPEIFDVFATGQSSYAIDMDGVVYNWGYNGSGDLGRVVAGGSVSSVNIGTLDAAYGATKIAGGARHALILMGDGSVLSCGNNTYGQLGRSVANGSATVANIGPIEFNGETFIDIIGSTLSSYLITTNGSLVTCGANNYGNLGRSVSTGSATVRNIGYADYPFNSGVLELGSGSYNINVRKGDGIWNVGLNDVGQLGRAIASGSATSINSGMLIGDASLHPGHNPALWGSDEVSRFSLFISDDETITTCGLNSQGQLGRAIANGSATVVNLGTFKIEKKDIKQVSCASSHSAILMNDGRVITMGNNAQGQLGRAVASGSATLMNAGYVENLPNVAKVVCGGGSTAGYGFTYFLLENGKIMNCGDNTHGQLGRIVANGSPTVVNLGVLGNNTWKDVACGGGHTLLISEDGSLYSCGLNSYGQCLMVKATGSPTVNNLSQVVASSSYGAFDQVSCGLLHSFALIPGIDTPIFSGGRNQVCQLGRSTSDGSQTVSNILRYSTTSIGGGTISKISCGSLYTTFLKSDGTVWNCGYNQYGELGRAIANGTNTLVNIGQVSTLSDIIDIESGPETSIFLHADRTVSNCGLNSNGGLCRIVGNGSATVPNLGKIPNLTDVTIISTGGYYIGTTSYVNRSIIVSNGYAFTAGYNNLGQLGKSISNGTASSCNFSPIIEWPEVTERKQFFVVGSTQGQIYYGNDGIDYLPSEQLRQRNTIASIAVSNSGRFVINAGNTSLYYSDDGITFSNANGIANNAVINGLTVNSSGRFVIVGAGYNYYSDDGINWYNSSGIGITAYNVAVNSSGRFVAIGSTGNVNPSYYSDDGINWLPGGLLGISTQSIAVNSSGRFVTISSAGARYSDDGINWIAGNGSLVAYNDISVSNSGRFVAVGSRGETSYSDNGIFWASGNGATGNLFGVTVTSSGKFFAVGVDGSFNSDDGINWTNIGNLPNGYCITVME